jgi:predicted dehydrogenase
LRGAIIGFGQVAELAHLPALKKRPEFLVVAAADPLSERRIRAQGLLPESHFYPDLESLLAGEPGLDFVDICTPPGGHVPLVEVALNHGCHVLCEKPLALAPEEFQQLKEAADRTATALVTVNNWKYAPLVSLATKMVRAGAIGKVQRLEWEVHRTSAAGGGLSAWRQDPANSLGGILLDHGWHAFYLLLEWAGGQPRSLRARLREDAAIPQVEVEAEIELKFPDLEARLFLTWQARQRSNRGRLQGTAGEIILADDHLSRLAGATLIESHSFPEKLSAGSHHPQWMAGVLDEFLEEIWVPEKRGRNFREAQDCARLIRLAYHSQQRRRAWINFPPG